MKLIKNKKFIISTISCLLVLVISGYFLGTQYLRTQQQTSTATRTIVTTINYDSLVETFDTYEYNQTEEKITLEADKLINLDYSELDNLSSENTDLSESTTNVHYSYEYDIEKNLIYMTVIFTELEEVVSSDTLVGVAFFDENGNLDAYFEIDGELYLMSQMADLSVMQDCGWFKSLFKKVAVAVVAVVVVSAVAAVVVATAGAGMAAVVAAGAIAGAITGGVAGGLISISEYGKLDWKWVVGGVVIGGALGAMTGWGVGTLMGAGSTSTATNSFVKAASDGTLKRTATVNNYYTSGQRTYVNSNQLASEIMQAKNPTLVNGLRNSNGVYSQGYKWVVEGVNNGSKGVWELVVDESKTIIHFLWKSL